jgi:hypothetical protein
LFDHATHVAGIIAAQVNGRGIAGVNPKAKVWGWEVLKPSQFAGSDPRKLARPFGLYPLVINISQTYPLVPNAGGKSDLELLLFGHPHRPGQDNSHVIVAAAGIVRDVENYGKEINSSAASECTFFPACWANIADRPPRNLISVVALNRSGTDLLMGPKGRPATNFGQAFDVSAVGETYSTLHGNWLGVQRGSSFAAPYVSGLASLLISKLKAIGWEYRIADVKERILATADRNPPLDRTSRFGRINFARAIDFEQDVIMLKPSGAKPCDESCRITGMLDRSVFPDEIRLVRSGQMVEKIWLKNIRRVIYEPTGWYTIYHIANNRLAQIRQVQWESPDRELFLSMSPGRIKGVKLGEIRDLTTCSFLPFCRGDGE